jgi:hypothetical protein
MLCIHVPVREIIWPLKKSWKLRCIKARRATEIRDLELLFAREGDVSPLGCGVGESFTFTRSIDAGHPRPSNSVLPPLN